jgi:hypothetical protein
MRVSRLAKLLDGSAGQRLVQRHLGQSDVRQAGQMVCMASAGKPCPM